MKIAVLGTGVYSLAIASALTRNNNEITMWTHDTNIKEEYTKTKQLKSIIDVEINNNIKVDDNLENVIKDASIIYIVTTSKFFNSLVKNMKPFYKKNTPICIATKGIDDDTTEFLSNVVKKELKTTAISVISGPTFAVDILNNEPAALSLATKHKLTCNMVLNTLPSSTLKLRVTNDLIGVQICGAVKNVVAIAAGITNGLGYSTSTSIFLINEALHDIKKTIYYLGGNKKTVLSYAGLGDLFLTCTSPKSRNYSFGYTIGKYKNEEKTNEYLKNNTVEGYHALISLTKLLNKHKIKIPLITLINDIISNKKNPEDLINFLIEKE